MEAFSDGVIAILITIMVLELHAPEGVSCRALLPVLPTFLAYVMSFIYLGYALYIAIALMWLVPDARIEKHIRGR